MRWVADIRKQWKFFWAWSHRLNEEKERERLRLQKQYPAEELERDANARQAGIERSLNESLEARLRRYEAEIDDAELRLSQVNERVTLLSVDYERDIAGCHENLERIKRRHQAIKTDLSEAYARLESAQAQVDAWYKKSNRSAILFGNRGKRLPRHAVFGQSFGDLDEAKGRRSEAVDDIESLKSERAGLSTEYKDTVQRLGSLQEQRKEMRQLRSRGYRLESLIAEAEILKRLVRYRNLRVRAAKRRQTRLIEEELRKSGVFEQRERASAMRSERDRLYRKRFAKESVSSMRSAFFAKWEKTYERSTD